MPDVPEISPWVYLAGVLIASLPGLGAVMVGLRNRGKIEQTHQQQRRTQGELATSNGETIGQLVEGTAQRVDTLTELVKQIAHRADAQRRDIDEVKGTVSGFSRKIEVVRTEVSALAGSVLEHLQNHMEDDGRHSGRRKEDEE